MKQLAKKIQSLALASTLVLSMGMAILPVKAHAATSLTAAPRVTFTFDDGLTSAVELAAPTLQKYGISATNYIITSCVGMDTAPNTCKADSTHTYMTWDQIEALRDTYGWNIGSHTVDHLCLASDCGGEQTVLTADEVRAQLTDSKSTLASNGFDALDFAAPYGDYNNTVLAEAAKQYATFRGFADIGYNIWPYDDRLVVNQQIQEGTTGDASRVTFDIAKGYVDAAIANNQWLTLTFHDVRTTAPTSSDDYAVSNALLDQIAAYVKTQVDAGKISVVSPHSAIVTGTNMLPNGSFDNGIADGWTTDDTTGALVKTDNGNNGSFVIGSTTGATNAVYMSASTANAHLFSPVVTVDPNITYIIKGFVNVTAMTAGEVAFYVDEYDANGAYLSSQYHSAVRYSDNVNAVHVTNSNFAYKPTTATVAKARVYVTIQGNSGIQAYIDNVEMINPNDNTATPPTGKTGDINGDGAVNINDLSILSNNWNKTGVTAAQGDLNGDGAVTINDLSILSSNWGK